MSHEGKLIQHIASKAPFKRKVIFTFNEGEMIVGAAVAVNKKYSTPVSI
jgi:hypothetical protein